MKESNRRPPQEYLDHLAAEAEAGNPSDLQYLNELWELPPAADFVAKLQRQDEARGHEIRDRYGTWTLPPPVKSLSEDEDGLRDDEVSEDFRSQVIHDLIENTDLDPDRVQRYFNDFANRDIARTAFEQLKSGESFEPLLRETLAELIANGIDLVSYRINIVAPKGGNVLISGPAKAGKTTLLLNLAKSLITGKSFLGLFPTRKIDGRVGFWNYELSAGQFVDWSKSMGLPTDQFAPLNLRGLHWDLMTDYCFKESVAWCQEMDVKALIVDPYSRAYVGDENNNTDVSRWTERIDELKHEAGIGELFLSAHFGRSHEERARGAQRLDDWADALWNYVADRDSTSGAYDYDGQRFFAAFGRDVEYAWPGGESVVYNDAKRSLALTGEGAGQSRGEAKLERNLRKVLQAAQSEPGLGAKELMAAAGIGNDEEARKAIDSARHRGFLPPSRGKGYKQDNSLTEDGERWLET